MEYTEISGLRIAYQRDGEGPSIVFLHGGVSDSRVWQSQFDALADEYTVVAWDAPGCGKSSDPPEGFSLADYADCLAELIDELNLEQPHLVGISFGAGLAIEFFNRHPTVPKSLLLAGAYAGWAGSLSPEEVERRTRKALRTSKLPANEVASSWTPSLFSESVSDDVIAETERIIEDFHPEGSITMLNAFADADLRHVLPTINVPTLLLYGSEDVRSPMRVAESLHNEIPNSELAILQGVGHVINLEAPESFNAELLNFKSRQDA